VAGEKAQAKVAPEREVNALEVGRVKRALERNPDWNDHRIARNARSQKSVVAEIRKELGL
jgi:hypothetical protein